MKLKIIGIIITYKFIITILTFYTTNNLGYMTLTLFRLGYISSFSLFGSISVFLIIYRLSQVGTLFGIILSLLN